MKRICIAFATGEGQTAKIADYIADVVRTEGLEADTVDIGHARDGALAGYDGIIVGSSIHMGKHDKHAVEWVRHNRDRWGRSRRRSSRSASPPTAMRPRRKATSRRSRTRPGGIPHR